MVKFYELTTKQRLQQLYQTGVLTTADLELLQSYPNLPTAIATNLIENQVGVFGVPLGLAENFVIDGQSLLIPMATEEPSVIAAASNAAKRCLPQGGFKTTVQRAGLIGQIVFEGQLRKPQVFLQQHLAMIHQVAFDAHPSLRQHGGGLKQVSVHVSANFVEFRLLVDPGEAMGANVVNTLAEAVAQYLAAQLPQLSLLMAILSNKAPQQSVTATATFALAKLATQKDAGEIVAQKIVAATKFAQESPLRAATHNKGIMNGINAVVLATGNDTRSINAASYAGLSKQQPTWTSWQIQDELLVGQITISLPLGSLGGAISTLPMAQLSMKILQQPSTRQLMSIVASVGLASNLSALRALVTQGIQAGHMNLQFKSLALMAGATEKEVASVVKQLRLAPTKANLQTTRQILQQLRLGENYESRH